MCARLRGAEIQRWLHHCWVARYTPGHRQSHARQDWAAGWLPCGRPSLPNEPSQPHQGLQFCEENLGYIWGQCPQKETMNSNHRMGSIHLWRDWGHYLERGQVKVSPGSQIQFPEVPYLTPSCSRAAPGPAQTSGLRTVNHTASGSSFELPTIHCSHCFSIPSPLSRSVTQPSRPNRTCPPAPSLLWL